MKFTLRKITVLLFCSVFALQAQERQQISSAINTEYHEMHPIISPDGEILYFVRESHPSNNFGKDGSIDVWYSQFRSDGRWSVARKMPNTINKDRFNDLFSITPDGNTVLIRGVYHNGRKSRDEVGISKCTKTRTGWTQPEKLDIPKLNTMAKGQFLSAFLSNNGKTLVFSFSEKKNGVNDDLYVSFLEKDGNWTKPESLGEDINTKNTETTPFLASDDYTLYFASDRKGGQGGVDIWVTKREDRSWKKWSKPINLGSKINTEKDDYHYSITASGEYAYMSTLDKSVGKGDIVRFKLRELGGDDEGVAALQTAETTTGNESNNQEKSEEEVLKEITATSAIPVVMLSGKVIDTKTKRPIEARIIYETFPAGEEVGVANTNPTTGEYKIVLPYGQRYTIRAEANDFIAIGKTIDLTQAGDFKEIKGEDLELAPIQTGVSVTLSNIFFKFASAELEEESFLELNRLADVLMKNRNMAIEVQGHTDNVGTAEVNLRLSQQRADAVRNYLTGKGVPMQRVTSVGLGETRPVASNETTEGQAKNRRVEFVITKN
ncbi:OmpA family protein [Jiulongibacter sediminis]|uniref:OmpA family protein n=1 Tax=Jiulongibacter sediminis TaxID=1605367 RepID=UPI0006DBF757|nr:OmpA family protein [Jiulongibacter sediminis]TBX23913.1 flagellar motor protein MotB [Jiulongibacter sediminis]